MMSRDSVHPAIKLQKYIYNTLHEEPLLIYFIENHVIFVFFNLFTLFLR